MAKKLTTEKASAIHGVLLIALFSCAAFYIAGFPFFKKISFSPLIIGIILGMLYANSLRNHLPETWVPGIKFSSKQLLRLGIILYGFRLTLQSIVEVGWSAIIIDAVVVTVTILLGMLVGKLLKMDRDTTLLTSIGSSICGAAAVLGADAALKPKPYKTAVAVTTVVIFGTLSMFLYPIVYRTGLLGLETSQMAVYTGSTLHEVAHVVGAGNAMDPDGTNGIEAASIIIKMIRVIMLVPVLLVLAFCVRPVEEDDTQSGTMTGKPAKRKITIPWFAFGFLAVICLNSLIGVILDAPNVSAALTGGMRASVNFINQLDTFLLTMAMTALGAETSFDKFKKAGPKPFLLAFVIYIWLLGGGYLLARYLAPFIG